MCVFATRNAPSGNGPSRAREVVISVCVVLVIAGISVLGMMVHMVARRREKVIGADIPEMEAFDLAAVEFEPDQVQPIGEGSSQVQELLGDLGPAVCCPCFQEGSQEVFGEGGESLVGQPMLMAMVRREMVPYLAQCAMEKLGNHLNGRWKKRGKSACAVMEKLLSRDGVDMNDEEERAKWIDQMLMTVGKLYTAEDIHEHVNGFLRTVDVKSQVAEASGNFWEYIILLQIFLMKAASSCPRTGAAKVYRGVNQKKVEARFAVAFDTFVQGYRDMVNETEVCKDFSSTSTDRLRAASKFAGGNGILYDITIPEAALQIPALGAVDMRKASFFPAENEVLFATNVPLRVKGVEMDSQFMELTVVEMEVDVPELGRLQRALESTWGRYGGDVDDLL
jgi:hypothetical protein